MNTDTVSLTMSVNALAKAKVLCVGDVMLDRFVYGNINRISPEAPIPIFNIESNKLMLGGAGNVTRNLSGLGAKTRFITVVGDDLAGTDIKKLISNVPNTKTTLITEKKRRTSIKTRYVASGQQMMRTDDETIAPIEEKTKQRLIKLVKSALNNNTAVILADYAKGVLTPEITKKIIGLAKKSNIPVIVDPQGANYKHYKGAHVITPNKKELSLATGIQTNSEMAIMAAGRKLISENGIKFVLATRSSDGMSLIDINNFNTFKAEAQEVFDVSGAGDTVAAAISASLSAGINLKQAVKIANTSAGIVVTKAGTAAVHASEIIEILYDREIPDTEKKIITIKMALDRAKNWRLQNYKIGFTNGCFDLLHPGHISTIENAKATCDKLIVGLNCDASIKRLKGSQRPIQSETTRAKILASLEKVDAVVIFSDNTPVKIINSLKPEIFIKGADYKISNIPEAKTVKAYGGKIILAEFKKGYSTSATISKLS